MASRVLGLLVLLYVASDLADPTVPGVFSFATDRFFVDGVVQVKTGSHITQGAAGVPTPMPPLSPVARPSDVKVASRAASPSPSQGTPSHHRDRSHPPDAATDRDQADDASVA
jgi:hypothetical protein